jgi:uncharacterized protein YhbP (UPF0306 family)
LGVGSYRKWVVAVGSELISSALGSTRVVVDLKGDQYTAKSSRKNGHKQSKLSHSFSYKFFVWKVSEA